MKYTLAVLYAALLVFCHASAGWAQSDTSPLWIQHAWANQGGRSVRAYAIGVGLDDQVFVTGRADFARDGATFDGMHLDSDSSHAFLVNYNGDGEQRWVTSGAFGDADSPYAESYAGFHIAVHDAQIYTSEGLIFWTDSGQLTTGGLSINRYDTNGNALQTVAFGDPDQSPGDWTGFINGFGVDQTSNVYVAGVYRDTLTFGTDTLVAFPFDDYLIGDVFLASYTPEGDLRWKQRIGGPRTDVIAEWGDYRGAFTVDAAGNTYLGGFFGRGAAFGEEQPGAITFERDAYALASFDAAGTLRWVRTERDLGISDNAGPWRLAVDGEGNLFVDWFIIPTGGAVTATVGDTTFTDSGYGGEFLTKLSPEGEILWARQLRSNGNEIISDLTTDTEGHIYIAGQFDGSSLQLEDQVLVKPSAGDMGNAFVAHYDATGRLLWVGHASGAGIQRIIALTLDASGNLYIAGEFREELRLGTHTVTAQGAGGLNMFVAKYDAASITLAHDAPPALPAVAELLPTYPNPFHSSTTLSYTLSQATEVHVTIYDVLGRAVATLVDELQTPGEHRVGFHAENLPAGVYIYRLEAGAFSASGRMVLMK